jgi:hypothetical protein
MNLDQAFLEKIILLVLTALITGFGILYPEESWGKKATRAEEI